MRTMITAVLAAFALASAASAADAPTPVVRDGSLFLPLGQAATVRLGADRGPALADPSSLSQTGDRYGGDVIQVTLSQSPGAEGRPGILLVVNNGYGAPLDYGADIYLEDGRRGPTSVCTVMANLTAIESWTDPIVAIRLHDFKPLPVGSQLACK